jgi:hypothetical protein
MTPRSDMTELLLMGCAIVIMGLAMAVLAVAM